MWIFYFFFYQNTLAKNILFLLSYFVSIGMRKFLIAFIGLVLCINTVDVDAAVRTQNTTNTRQTASTKTRNTNTTTRSVTPRTTTVVQRQSTSTRNASSKVVTGRSATTTTARSAVATQPSRSARAATTTKTRTFSSNYNACRDAYFTCMDQFCATQNESYRRCVCSSKLSDIQKQEKLLSQTAESLQDFESLNIDMISKTSGEVKAMLSASEGEAAIKKDTSSSSTTLKNITSVLNNSKKKSLSTQGTLDIGGDIKSIWSTTNLIGGADIANLTGESLFNAVHAQCADLVAQSCAGSDFKMVSSAYGMYIENDCALLENSLKNKRTGANASIRQTRHKMQDARLENYDAHNSASINDCIANVRKDILADTACGDGYIHCLDFSGKYLNITTGKPIYSADFYQIENQISLSGDVLKNNKNSSFITMLNKKRSFAEKDLDLCRDDADNVWNEFMRQAIVEIYQQQQERVKEVKEECLQVVNECYLKQSDALKSLTDSSKIGIGQTLELSEEMCAEKLNTCSNLYGGGKEGLAILTETMTGITTATIEQSCPDLLTEFAHNICAVTDSDSSHSYPYGCRKYAPGESTYAKIDRCNTELVNPFSRSEILNTWQLNLTNEYYSQVCENKEYTKRYSKCKPGYYLYNADAYSDNQYAYVPADGNNGKYPNECRSCSLLNAQCAGGTAQPISTESSTSVEIYNTCGRYYIGSLYQQFVIYALQNCKRPSENLKETQSQTVSETVLMNIDKVMQDVRSALVISLAKECELQNGGWKDIPWIDEDMNGKHDRNGDVLLNEFYISTGANTLWGYCRDLSN